MHWENLQMWKKMDWFLLLRYLNQQDIEVFSNLIDRLQVQVNDESKNIFYNSRKSINKYLQVYS
jgi:hypothetical protein